MPECCPCLNFEENPHAELNVYSFLFCFYYMLCSRYPFAFRNIRLFFFFFFYSIQTEGRPCSLMVEIEVCSPLLYSWFIRLRLHQEPLKSAVVNYTGSLVHVMLWTSQGLLFVCSRWLFTVKNPSWFSKPGSSYPSMTFTVKTAPREEGLPVGSSGDEWDGWPGLCYYCC